MKKTSKQDQEFVQEYIKKNAKDRLLPAQMTNWGIQDCTNQYLEWKE